jgi:hypothetical protein
MPSAAVLFMPLRRPGIAVPSAAPGPDHATIIQGISHLFSFPSSGPWDAFLAF